MKKCVVILADGFEEIEAMTVIDILRRASIEVTVAGLDKKTIISTHQVPVICDRTLSEIEASIFDAIILPGGEPGTTNLQKSEKVSSMLKAHVEHHKYIAAICAAPRILAKLGLLQNRFATSYPAMKPDMQNCCYSEDSVVVDGQFITSRGPGTAMAFAYKLVDCLVSEDSSKMLQKAMLWPERLLS